MKKQKFYEILYVVCFIVFSISILYIVTYLFFTYKDESDIEEIQSIMSDISKVEYQNNIEIINYTNVNDTNNVENTIVNEETLNEDAEIVNFKKVKQINSNIVAWLKIEETKINYPILQGNDNDYYLNKNFKNQYSRNGSIFLDYRYDFSKINQNFLVYGHNNRDGMMFQDLLKYENKDYFDSHSKIKLITENENKVYDIIAVFKSQVYSVTDTDVFRYYNYINFENENKFNEYIKNCKKNSLYNIDIEPTYGDEILTLSTCEYSKENGRFVIVATKKK